MTALDQELPSAIDADDVDPSDDRPARSPALAGAVVLRVPVLNWTTRVQMRAVVVTLICSGLAFLVFCYSLTLGDFPIPFVDVVKHVIGIRSEDTNLIIGDFRMPRALLAGLIGASFGVSGAVLQRIARNPLASPDMIGITHGAVAAAVYFVVVVEASSFAVSMAALGEVRSSPPSPSTCWPTSGA